MSDPTKSRLNRRRAEFVRRVEILEGRDNGRRWVVAMRRKLPLHAWDEMSFVRQLYEVLYLRAFRPRWNVQTGDAPHERLR